MHRRDRVVRKLQEESQQITDDEREAAYIWAADNPHLSYHLRKTLAHINFLQQKDGNRPTLADVVEAAGSVC